MPVYLIHLYQPLSHARHYIGYASNVAKRFDRHVAGNGARMLAAATDAKIDYDVVRVWPKGNREFERELKAHKKSADFCPLCSGKTKGNGHER
jgi:putative endonuclease